MNTIHAFEYPLPCVQPLVDEAEKGCRVRLMLSHHVEHFVALLHLIKGKATYICHAPCAPHKKPNSYRGRMESTVLYYYKDEDKFPLEPWRVKAVREDKACAWVFKVKLNEGLGKDDLPTEFGGETWKWKKIGAYWYAK